MSVSEADLLAHCLMEISERAAIPRTIRMIEPMPLTAVGEIFKPELRLDAVRRCVEDVAARLDGERVSASAYSMPAAP
jgi:fatty-acyl-CoA synthase